MTAAQVTYHDSLTGHTEIRLGAHRLQYGGRDGDGYCHGHQSFECIPNLTPDERRAVEQAQ